MKNIFLSLAILLPCIFANAATELWWWSGTKDNPSYFSKAGITVTSTTDLTPYSKNDTQEGENYFVLDQSITVQMFRSLWQSSNQHISMTEGSELTIDTAPNGKDGYFTTIELRGTEPYGQNSMTFDSGTINIINSASSSYNMGANIGLNQNSTGANNKILTFESGTTLNSELALYFYGANNTTYPSRSVVNLNGTLNTGIADGDIVKYNSVTLKGDDNNSIIVNFGETATVNIGKVNIEKNSIMNVAKGANIFIDTRNSGIAKDNPNLQIDANAVLNLDGNLKISAISSTHAMNIYGTINVGKDASVYIKDGGYRNVVTIPLDVKPKRSLMVKVSSDNPVDVVIANEKGAAIAHKEGVRDALLGPYSTGKLKSMGIFLGLYPGDKAKVNIEAWMERE